MDKIAKMTAFAKVAEAGSFTKAAQQLRLSPTIISKHVRELEEALGVRLLNRTTRKVSLTEVGSVFYQRCSELLTQLEDLENAAGRLQSTPSGVLRVSAPLAFGATRVADVLPRFAAIYPHVTVELILMDRYVDVVEEGFDLAITMDELANSTYITRLLCTMRMILCAAPEYIARHGRPETPQALAQHNCFTHLSVPLSRPWAFTGPGDVAHTVKVSGNLRSNSAAAQMVAALQGQGVSLQPEFMVLEELRAGRLVRLLEAYTIPGVPIRLVYPPGRYVAAKLRAFIDFLAASLGNPQPPAAGTAA
jgi:DNA-binding transcriptional LysR family regulator